MLLCGMGIDPGLKGAVAIALECDTGPPSITVHDMPTNDVVIAGKTRQRIDRYQLDALFTALSCMGVTFAVQEQVWARPLVRPGKGGAPRLIKPNAGSALQLGLAAGAALQALASHQIPHQEIPPADWKRALGVSANKEEARAAASRLMPHAAHLWPLVKHDGRAEAALLALYSLQLSRGLR